jgi:hypothetical protein
VLAVCGLEALALGVFVVAASARGWRLALGLAALMFGVMMLQPQVEAVAFGVIRMQTAARIGVMGLIISVVVAPLAVLVFWRWRAANGQAPARVSRPADREGPASSKSPRLVWAIPMAALMFVLLYLVFGYFIAWRSEEVRAFYGGENSSGFLSHIWALQLRVPWFLPLQFARGCLWAGLGLIGLPLLSGSWKRAGCVLGLFLAVVMNAQLLLPNAAMPETVRLVHIAETAPANFSLGVVLAWMLHRRSECVRPQ